MSDLLIVGGGVIGLCIAETALREGLKVTLIDKGLIGREASWAGAGMLTCRPRPRTNKHPGEPDYHDLTLLSTRLHAHLSARLKETTGGDVGYRVCGALELLTQPPDDAAQRNEIDSLLTGARERGVRCNFLNAAELRAREANLHPRFTGALEFPDEAQVRNPWLVRVLAVSVRKSGAAIIENTPARDLKLSANGSMVEGVVTANGDVIRARHTVICNGAWAAQLETLVKLVPGVAKVHPVRGQLLCYQTDPRLAQRLLTCDHNYIVPRGDGVVLVGATQEKVGFDKSVTDDGTRALAEFAQSILPKLSNLAPVQTWTGLRPGLSGRHPLLGPVAGVQGLHVALGHYRNGLTLGPATAELVVSQIVGKTPEISLGPWLPE